MLATAEDYKSIKKTALHLYLCTVVSWLKQQICPHFNSYWIYKSLITKLIQVPDVTDENATWETDQCQNVYFKTIVFWWQGRKLVLKGRRWQDNKIPHLLWTVRAIAAGSKLGTCESFFLRSNRISNRIGRPIRFRIEFSNQIGRIYHASHNTV